MREDKENELPLGFAMALAHNPKALNSFLKMEDTQQDSLISQAKCTKTKREMEQLVDNISIT